MSIVGMRSYPKQRPKVMQLTSGAGHVFACLQCGFTVGDLRPICGLGPMPRAATRLPVGSHRTHKTARPSAELKSARRVAES